MDIEILRDIAEQVRYNYEQGHAIGFNLDDHCHYELAYGLKSMLDEAIARQSVKSEEVAEAIEQMEDALSPRYLESDGEWTGYNEFSTSAIRTAITALQAYQPSDEGRFPNEAEREYNANYEAKCKKTGVNLLAEPSDADVRAFSGFYDKNKTPVREGDIISLVTADGESITVTCKFGKIRRQIYENLVEINGFYFERSNDGRKTFPIVNNYLGKHDTEIWEVVGNMHDQQTKDGESK